MYSTYQLDEDGEDIPNTPITPPTNFYGNFSPNPDLVGPETSIETRTSLQLLQS